MVTTQSPRSQLDPNDMIIFKCLSFAHIVYFQKIVIIILGVTLVIIEKEGGGEGEGQVHKEDLFA